MTIKTKAYQSYFTVGHFVMLCKVISTFDFMNCMLRCDRSNGRYCAINPVMFLRYKVGLTFEPAELKTN